MYTNVMLVVIAPSPSLSFTNSRQDSILLDETVIPRQVHVAISAVDETFLGLSLNIKLCCCVAMCLQVSAYQMSHYGMSCRLGPTVTAVLIWHIEPKLRRFHVLGTCRSKVIRQFSWTISPNDTRALSPNWNGTILVVRIMSPYRRWTGLRIQD